MLAEAPEGSVRLWRALVQIPWEVPEGSGADTLARFLRVLEQVPGEVPEISSAAT